jgi:Flp pilus assembly protein TadD
VAGARGRRVRIFKAEISRDKIEVELEGRGWPDEASRLARAARDLYEKGARRNALSMCREALELDSLNVDAMTTLGVILTRLERDKEALDALKHAREFGAQEIEVTLAMAECALRLGRLGTAAQYAHEALRLDPRNLAARRILKALRHEQ